MLSPFQQNRFRQLAITLSTLAAGLLLTLASTLVETGPERGTVEVGEGVKTVLPARAMAKMDFRLVPNQDPDDILAKLTHGKPLTPREIRKFIKVKFHAALEVEHYQHDVLNRMINKRVSLDPALKAVTSMPSNVTNCAPRLYPKFCPWISIALPVRQTAGGEGGKICVITGATPVPATDN